jgi:cytoskeleton protein RodZ
MPEIGAALREARMRARIDISEIEAQTKIRAKYLRALENEEWDLLPGPTFVKSFLRTYAQALDLDDKALVEEYRASYERPNEAELQPIVSTARRPPGQRGGGRGVSAPSRGYTIAIAVVSLLIVVLIVALLSGGGSSNNTPTTTARVTTTTHHRTHHSAGRTSTGTTPSAQSNIVALSVQPTGTVYVCLIGEGGKKLIPGSTLQPGSTQPTYHAKRFLLTLGNNSVKLLIDGSVRPVPASSQPIGYSITKAGGRHSLPAAQQPTCK